MPWLLPPLSFFDCESDFSGVVCCPVEHASSTVGVDVTSEALGLLGVGSVLPYPAVFKVDSLHEDELGEVVEHVLRVPTTVENVDNVDATQMG